VAQGRTLLRLLSYLLTWPCEKNIRNRRAAGYPYIHSHPQKKKNQKENGCYCGGSLRKKTRGDYTRAFIHERPIDALKGALHTVTHVKLVRGKGRD